MEILPRRFGALEDKFLTTEATKCYAKNLKPRALVILKNTLFPLSEFQEGSE